MKCSDYIGLSISLYFISSLCFCLFFIYLSIYIYFTQIQSLTFKLNYEKWEQLEYLGIRETNIPYQKRSLQQVKIPKILATASEKWEITLSTAFFNRVISLNSTFFFSFYYKM